MQPLLSIVIPSNNRTELLDEAVQSILAERGPGPLCEICISDNSSGDATEKLIATKYLPSGDVTYRRSIDAPSLDENVNKVATIANGEYVWFFGDDDLLVKGFLARLLDYLKEVRPDILIVNSLSFQGAGIVESSRVPFTDVRIYGPLDNNEFLSDFGGYLTYVAGIVIKKNLWGECFRDEKVGTFFAHIDAICRAKLGRSVHYLPEPGIGLRLHTQTWTARHFEIWNVHYPAVIWGLNGYSDEAKQSVIPRHPMNSFKRILASRAYGRFNLEICRSVLIRSNSSNPLVKMFGLVVAVLPREPFRLLYVLFIRVVRRRHHRGFSPELALVQLGRIVK
jgi:abequosyltransferase